MDLQTLLKQAIKASIIAGKAVMYYYNTSFEIEYKADQSPLTSADNASHEAIISVLSFSDIPILSEEGKNIPFEVRKEWDFFWLVDPLDGTKEFINHNGEFTINIALVNKGQPVMGIIYLPVNNVLYFGSQTEGAYRKSMIDDSDLSDSKIIDIIADAERLPLFTERPVTILGSRSHQTTENIEFINKISTHFKPIDLINAGSSLKFCRIAEGAADIYPRLGPTMEWDTAAGHAICKASGVKVLKYNTKDEIVYNKSNLLNPWFVAVSPDFEQYI
ncbi:MAG: 3'(2'),5'-bisphosphate nucleotidase CysQ [Chloroflexota bacterium]|nr:3'(2'),5'-bisphosphate nucleotidase CysQ [Lentimicrobium sp.]